MTYESFEPVKLGSAEVAIEIFWPEGAEEPNEKFSTSVAPYVEFDE